MMDMLKLCMDMDRIYNALNGSEEAEKLPWSLPLSGLRGGELDDIEAR